jgi:hypothetical protein
MKTRHFSTGRILFPALLVMAGLLLFSCTQFFSNSWAPWAARAYDKIIPTVTVDNVDELISIFENDPNGSLALLKKIRDAHNDESSPELEAAALKAAVNSIGLVSAIAGATGNMNDWGDPEKARNKFDSVLDDMENLEDASEVLFEILPGPDDKEAWANFTKSASADDLAMGAILLLLGAASGNVDFNNPDEFDEFTNNPGNEKIALARALVDASIEKTDDKSNDDGLSDSLIDILKSLNLWTKP